MATINFNDAVADPTLVENFDPAEDILNFTDVSSTDVTVGKGDSETTFTTAAGTVTLPVDTKALVGLGSDPNVTFADNSVLVVGDSDRGTAFDDFGQTIGWTSAAHQIHGLGGADSIDAANATATNTVGVEVYGNQGADTLNGGTGADTLFGGQDADTIGGTSGDDLLYGNQGADTVHGDSGSDSIFGGQGADTLFGGNDDDLIYGNKGEDTLSGGTGDDVLFGGQDADTVIGDAGSDSVYGNAGADTLNGGAGDDSVFGGQGDDLINVAAAGGSDLIYGNKGADTIVGNGNDTIFGGDGADSIQLGAGASDVVLAGAGADTLDATGVAASDNTQIDLGDGDDTFQVATAAINYTAPEVIGGAGNDELLVATTGAITLNGQFAGFEDIRITGSNAADIDASGQGNSGYNVIVEDGSKLQDFVGTDFSDTVSGGTLADTIFGGDGNDELTGGSGADSIAGQSGDDVINGGAGSDTLTGGDGADEIVGGASADTIIGGAGSDTLTGDGGSDALVLNDFETADTVTDFDSGNDYLAIDLGASGVNKVDSGATTGATSYRFVQTGGTTTALADAATTPGSGAANSILFTGAADLSALKSSIAKLSLTTGAGTFTGTFLALGTTTGSNKVYLLTVNDTNASPNTGASFVSTRTLASLDSAANLADGDIAIF